MGLFTPSKPQSPPEYGAMFPAVQDLRQAAKELADAAAKINKLLDAMSTNGVEITIKAK